MEDLKYKEDLLKFVEIVEKVKTQENIQITNEEKEFIMTLKDKYNDNPEYLELLDKIVQSPKGEAIQVVNEFYKQQKEEQQEEKTPEEEISKVFGVSASQIKHLYLKNGKEVFFFYSATLGRDIVLENNKTGHSISEVLEEIQESDEKYQSENSEENANDIMMDTRLKTNLEFDMYPPEEVPQHTSELEQLHQDERALLNYLLSHVEELDIKTINIEHLIYITNRHEIKQISYDKDFKPVIDSPAEEENTSVAESSNDESVDEVVSEEESSIEDDNSNQELGDMLDDEVEKETERQRELQESKDAKKLVLTKQNEQGYAAYIGLIVALIAIIALTFLGFHILSLLN